MTAWRKSSWSTSPDNNCVEVARSVDEVALRDSKDPDGPVLRFSLDAWIAFVAGVRAAEFDRSGLSTME